VAVAARRLPGIAFEAEGPPPLTVLPRMDVAVLVGFAASGPLDIPVAVQDPLRFEALFGGDTTLYRDERTGDDVRAHLAPAVRAFFRNGGRRCFVVRVAGSGARASSFAVPGLLARRSGGSLSVPLLRARSEGSWSDDLRVASALVESPLMTTAIDPSAWRVTLAAAPTPVGRGDLLRVSLPTAGYVVYVAVDSVDGSTVSCDPASALWLRVRRAPPSARATVRFIDRRGAEQMVAAWIERTEGTRVRVLLPETAAGAPRAGSLLAAIVDGDESWIAVSDVSGGGEAVELTGEAFWPVPTPSRRFAADPLATVDVCTFELWVEHGGMRSRLGGLGFAPGHARYAGALPTDAALYEGRGAAPLGPALPALWTAAADPRFPLAGPAEDVGVLYPLGMGALPEPAVGALLPEGTQLERDGLASFEPGLFLDARLAGSGTDALIAEADFYRLGGEAPPRGLHAALIVDEATILAVPDAVQRPWTFVPSAPARAPRRRHPHRRRPSFEPCGRLHPPELAATPADATGSFTLTWHGVRSRLEYVVQEAHDPEFADGAELYRGRQTRLDVFGRDPGAWYYRVRAQRAGETGPWSTPVAIAIAREAGWRSAADDAFDQQTLLAVQAGALRLAAARGDLLVLLSLPGHYREDSALAHARTLREALAAGEQRALGFGALYHPWPTTSRSDDPTAFASTPPDGTIAGVVARRARRRGAWTAPANEPLRDVIALDPPIDPNAYRSLQDAQLNVLRREPNGFLVLSADTLTDDVDVRPINVRRLLALLRRAALLHGTRYVFEPHDDALRRRVERGFEDLLGLLFRLGAFAGATASEAFRVGVGDPPNSRQSVDEGRLIVELKVAPSLPLRFLTVRLVERAERGLQLESL